MASSETQDRGLPTDVVGMGFETIFDIQTTPNEVHAGFWEVNQKVHRFLSGQGATRTFG